jgi:hypothetical protein
MAKVNKYLAEREARDRACFQAGLESGRQQILDMMSLVLRDKNIMGKDIFGKDRLMGVVKGIGEYIDKYELAWQKHDETDYIQKMLDENLAEAYGEELHDSFHVRYPYAPEYDYEKGKWK